MIKDIRLTTTFDEVTVEWDRPKYLPESYKLTGWCRDISSGQTRSLTTVSIPCLRHRKKVMINGGSDCEVTFVAIYNRASIDPGITKRIRVHLRSKLINTITCNLREQQKLE